MIFPSRARALLLFLLLSGVPAGLSAQIPVQLGASGAELSRENLTQLLQEYDAAATSSAYSGGIRDAARTRAAMIRDRLENGDFKPGDRVAIFVQGEPNLPDTVMVEPGPQITLPLFGSISLSGVLRSEIQEHLTRELGKIIHDPVVRAHGLMRLSIQGSVGRPGFYVVPADVLVTDVLMMAGGPAGDAKLDKLRIERGSQRILEGEVMQDALLQGRTLDQLNLQAGDQIYLPRKGASMWPGVLRYGLVIATSVILGRRFARGY
jgi:protein involved in polysaccharide export with SLBB domain